MKRLLKIKFSGGTQFAVRLRRALSAERPGAIARRKPSGRIEARVVRLLELAHSTFITQPRRGSLALAVPPPYSPAPGRALARRPRRGDSFRLP